MSDRAEENFRKQYYFIFTGDRREKKKEEGYYRLLSFISTTNEGEIKRCLQEYLKIFANNKLVDDDRSSAVFRRIILRRIKTISSIENLNNFSDEIRTDTPTRRRIKQIMAPAH